MRRAGGSSCIDCWSGLRLGRAAADNAVRPERKNIARAGDGDSVRLGRERPPLEGVVRFAKDDLVDLVQGEARDVDRRVGQDQLLELNLQLAPKRGGSYGVDPQSLRLIKCVTP